MFKTHPVLTCADSIDWETKPLAGGDIAVWSAMSRAGEAIATSVLRDYLEFGPVSADNFRILVLCGSGHNAGDALVAAEKILRILPQASATALLISDRDKMRPLAARALSEYEGTGSRARVVAWSAEAAASLKTAHFDLCLEGIVGMSMRPPLRDPIPEIIALVKGMDIDMRAAVDLPAGLGDQSCPDGFIADFTYSTGIAKTPLFSPSNVSRTGRIRYLDIGFFDGNMPESSVQGREILLSSTIRPLRALRKAGSDKRDYGHLFIMGGSRQMPGALAMAAMAAVRSGAGLVTALVPSNLSSRLAVLAPEAMWTSLPVSSEGAFNVEESMRVIRRALERATAMVIGPGLDLASKESRTVVGRIVRECPLPIILDAGALIDDVVTAAVARPFGVSPLVFTPHIGEFARIAGEAVLERGCDIEKAMLEFSSRTRSVLVLKGSITRVAYDGRILYDTFGGPVLSRGGSGDILSGMIGALVAKKGADVLDSVCMAVVWNGLAAEHLARARGQQAVRTTEILDHLSPALRDL